MNDATQRRFAELRAGGLLPSPKGVALSILDAASNPDVHLAELVRRVQTDPATAGRLLRYANSAAVGSQRHIVSLQQAITLLGVFRVRQVALAFTLLDQYRRGACPGFDYAGYWTASLATGIAAQQLATLAASPPDESFTCGLLAGIGRLALATAFPEDYGALLARGLDRPAHCAEEVAHFGIDHADLAAEMLSAWGLPDLFADAVRHHEAPADAPAAPGSRAYALTAALHLASQIGELLHLDEAQRWARVPTLYDAAARAGLEQDQVAPLIATIVTRWQGWARELNLPTRTDPDLDELLGAPPIAPDTATVAGSLPPLRIALLIEAPSRRRRLQAVLGQLGVRVIELTGLDALARDGAGIDVLLIEADGGPAALTRLRTAHRQSPALHCLALVDARSEREADRLLQAGAADVVRHDAPAAVLAARLHNAQQVIALRSSLKVERELAVRTAGAWAKTNRRLIHDALTDPLTQLPNRRYGLDRLAQEWSVARSNALPLGAMMIDIDHFKQVNDTHGHDVGDLVLARLSAVLVRTCRRSDVVFRYGGEEFAVLCPATDRRAAGVLAERLLAAVRAEPFGTADAPLALTVSIGIAIRSPATLDAGALLVAADEALYRAKQGGRDRAEFAGEAPPA